MSSRREILQSHYVRLMRKVAAWVGMSSLMATMLVPMSASAGTLTGRSVAVGDSKLSASTTYDFTFKPTAATTIKTVVMQICTSPLAGTCTQVTGSSMNTSSTFSTSAPTSALFSSFTASTSSGAPTATSFQIHNSSGAAVSAGTAYTLRLTNIVNPSTANLQYYARITTYSDDASTTTPTTQIDFGGVALSTGNEMTVAANVQESLNFTVGASGTCGSISGSSVNICSNPGSDNVLQLGTATAGTSVMCINTNASSGYTISYISNSSHNNAFTNGTYDIADNSTGSTFASAVSGGTDFFGMNLVANNGGSSGPTAGSAVSGGTAPTGYGTGYGTANTYAFAHGAVTNLVSETTGPSANALYTVTYAAVAGNSTATGAYQVKLNYIATGTF